MIYHLQHLLPIDQIWSGLTPQNLFQQLKSLYELELKIIVVVIGFIINITTFFER